MEKEKDCYESGEGKKSRMAGLCSGVGPCGHLLSISARTDTDPVYRRSSVSSRGQGISISLAADPDNCHTVRKKPEHASGSVGIFADRLSI